MSSISNLIGGVYDLSKKVVGGSVSTGDTSIAASIIDEAKNIIEKFAGTAVQLQKTQFNMTKQHGGSIIGAQNNMLAVMESLQKSQADFLYGLTGDRGITFAEGLQSATGRRFNVRSEKEMQTLGAVDSVFGDKGESMNKLSAAYLSIGSNLEAVGQDVADLFNRASKTGLSFKTMTDTVKENIGIVNSYGFKNGINGLKKMAELSAKIGLDMKEVLSASDKMSDLSGAIESSANLSVLGGQFQSLSNPLEILNESLTDVEGLQERIGKMFSGMAKFDPKKGMLTISALDRMRIKGAASALGISSSAAIKSVETQGRSELIERQIGNGLEDRIKNVLANTGTINKEGRAGYTDKDGKFWDVSLIAESTDLQNQILEENRSEGENIYEIAQNTRSLLDIINNTKAGYQTRLGKTELDSLPKFTEAYTKLMSPDGIIGRVLNDTIDLKKVTLDVAENLLKYSETINKTVNDVSDGKTSVGTGVATVAKDTFELIKNGFTDVYNNLKSIINDEDSSGSAKSATPTPTSVAVPATTSSTVTAPISSPASSTVASSQVSSQPTASVNVREVSDVGASAVKQVERVYDNVYANVVPNNNEFYITVSGDDGEKIAKGIKDYVDNNWGTRVVALEVSKRNEKVKTGLRNGYSYGSEYV